MFSYALWSIEVTYNENAEWLQSLRVTTASLPLYWNLHIAIDQVSAAMKKLKNWVVPDHDHDQVHRFGVKHLTSLHFIFALSWEKLCCF